MKIKIEDVSIVHTNLGWGIKDKKTGLFYTNESDKLWVSKERVNVLWFRDSIKTLDFIYKTNKN
jgi:hypothetical protein